MSYCENSLYHYSQGETDDISQQSEVRSNDSDPAVCLDARTEYQASVYQTTESDTDTSDDTEFIEFDFYREQFSNVVVNFEFILQLKLERNGWERNSERRKCDGQRR